MALFLLIPINSWRAFDAKVQALLDIYLYREEVDVFQLLMPSEQLAKRWQFQGIK
jgi:hypothetical protein